MSTNISAINPIFKGNYNIKAAKRLKNCVTKPVDSCDDTFISKTRHKLRKPILKTKFVQRQSKKLSNILRREISSQEYEKIIQEYNELFNITDRDTFFKKAFEKVKKDYGYEGKDIQLTLIDQGNGAMGWNNYFCNININSKTMNRYYAQKKLNKYQQIDILEGFIHEFQHAKQSEYAFRTNPEKYLEHIFNDKDACIATIEWLENTESRDIIKQMIKNDSKFNFKSDKEMEEFLSSTHEKLKSGTYENNLQIKNLLNIIKKDQHSANISVFGDFEKFPKNSEKYLLGTKYLENEKNYIRADIDTLKFYRNQLVENEAYKAQENFFRMLEPYLTIKEKFQIKLINVCRKVSRKYQEFIGKQIAKSPHYIKNNN